jgi:competence protein ComFC
MRIYSIFTYFFNILFGEGSDSIQITNLSVDNLEKLVHLSTHDTCQALSCFSYRSPTIRNLIHTLKYKGNYRAAQLLAPFLAEALLDKLGDDIMFGGKTPLLIPIPLSKERMRERRYNQAEILTREIAYTLQRIHDTTLPLRTDILLRVKNTPSQTTLKKQEREKNQIGAFIVNNKNAIKGEYIILVDDVLTTGSTLKEARKTLLIAGAGEVSAITVAH